MAAPPLINRSKQPYRLYKPLFIDDKQIKLDLDRELESISQALLWVTVNMETVVSSLNTLLPEGDKIKLEYPVNGRGNNNG